MSISTKQSSDLSSGQNLAWTDEGALAALKELANTREDAGGVRFLARFPDFIRITDTDWMARLTRPYEVNGAAEVNATPARTASPLFGILKRVGERLLPTPESHIHYLSVMVREIWRGTPDGTRLLLIFLLINEPGEAIKTAIALRDMESDPKDILREVFSFLPAIRLADHLQPNWMRQGVFRYTAATPLQQGLYALWGKSSLAKVCRNDACPEPFFIASRVQQQYCGDECATPSRLEAKRKYWDSKGKQRRERALKSKRGKR